VINKTENVNQINDKPTPSVSKVAKDWEYGPFSGALPMVKSMGEELWI
jgi:carboxypeptidase PM20D1